MMLSPLFIPGLGFGELALVLVLVLLLFGPGKLPQVAQSLGEAVNRFRNGSEGKGESPEKTPEPEHQQTDTTSDSPDSSEAPKP